MDADLLPTPHWTLSGGWEAIDEARGVRVEWPAGFDPAGLPRPRHALRERVRFRWKGRWRVGEVRDIKLSALGQLPQYIIYTSGHGYWVGEDQVE